MFYAMKQEKDEYGCPFVFAIRKRGFNNIEKAISHCKKKGKGSFVINSKNQVQVVI